MSGRTQTGAARLITAAVVAAIVAGGCGSGTSPEAKPAMVVSAAADKTLTGTASLAGNTALVGDGERLVVQRFSGSQDFDGPASELQMRSPKDPTDEDRGETVIDMISTAGAAYQRISDLELPAGKEWIRIVPEDLGVDPTDAQALGSQDPADGLQFLAGIRNARVEGEEEVRGEPTTRYAVTIDLERLMDLLAEGSKKLTPEFGKGLELLRGRVDLSRLPGDVWLDERGRVRRFTYSIPLKVKGQTIRTVSTLEYFDFGAPLSIAAPPEAETVPYAEAEALLREYLSNLAPASSSSSAA